MTGTNHGMTGAVIALAVKQPYLAIPIAFASHFVCDSIPHFGFDQKYLFKRRFNVLLAADFILALSMMATLGIIFPDKIWIIWGCMVAAASPDLMWLYYHGYIGRYKHQPLKLDPLARFHAWIQWSQTISGTALEVAWFLLMAAVLMAWR